MGLETAKVADELGIKRGTLSEAARGGHLRNPVKKTLATALISESDRSAEYTLRRCAGVLTI